MCGVFLPFSLYSFIVFVQQELCSFTFKLLEIILLNLKVHCISTMNLQLLVRILSLSTKCHLQKSLREFIILSVLADKRTATTNLTSPLCFL